ASHTFEARAGPNERAGFVEALATGPQPVAAKPTSAPRPAGGRAHRYSHAVGGWHRGDAPHHGRRCGDPATRANYVRSRRIYLRIVEGRRQRVPPEGCERRR